MEHDLRAAAVAADARTGAAEIATAEEKIGEALEQLARIDEIKKIAGQIVKNATKIDSQSAGLSAAIRRLLDQALEALAGVSSSADGPGADLIDAVDGAA